MRLWLWARRLFHNKTRFRELSPWRQKWWLAWDWLEVRLRLRLWRNGIRPHLMPRRYAKDCYRFWLSIRVPAAVQGVTYPSGLTGKDSFIADLDPFHECTSGLYAYGGTRDEAKAEVMRIVASFADEAGTIDPGGYVVIWEDLEDWKQERAVLRSAVGWT